MPIQFPDFGRISFAEANPGLMGAQAGLGMIGQGQDMLTKLLQQQKMRAELPYAGESAKATSAYKAAMANYLSNPYQSQRFMTTLGKTLNEQRMAVDIPAGGQVQGIEPTGEKTDQQKKYDLLVQKMTSDNQTRQRNLFAANIDKTLSYIDPKVLSKYSGFGGKLNKANELLRAPFGAESIDYDKYSQQMQAVDLLSKQIRQFYGASITPMMERKLNELVNPESWSGNPKISENKFNELVKILKNEMKTYQQATESTDIYKGKKEGSKVEGKIELTKMLGNKKHVMINGKWYET